MTYEIHITGLEGFSTQYRDVELAKVLNDALDGGNFSGWDSLSKVDLLRIGQAVSKNVKLREAWTEDNYTWFGGLEFEVDCGRIVVLFPWARDRQHLKTKPDKSINIYTNDKNLPIEVVRGLLGKIAGQFRETN